MQFFKFGFIGAYKFFKLLCGFAERYFLRLFSERCFYCRNLLRGQKTYFVIFIAQGAFLQREACRKAFIWLCLKYFAENFLSLTCVRKEQFHKIALSQHGYSHKLVSVNTYYFFYCFICFLETRYLFAVRERQTDGSFLNRFTRAFFCGTDIFGISYYIIVFSVI